MPGQTPVLGLPYPEGTDPVMDGDDVIQSLAERVELKTFKHIAQGNSPDPLAPAPSQPDGLVLVTGFVEVNMTMPGVGVITFPAGAFPGGVMTFNVTTMNGHAQNPVVNAARLTRTSAEIFIQDAATPIIVCYVAIGW